MVHGTAYEWSTLSPLDNALVEVSTTPRQQVVAVNGTYSFNLPPGDYLIKAQYFRNSTLIYSGHENISVRNEGNFTLDLLLFPGISADEEPDDLNFTGELYPENRAADYTLPAAIILLVAVGAVVIGWKLMKKPKVSGAVEEPAGTVIDIKETAREELKETKKDAPVPADLSQILDMLEKCGGRATQKDLRKQMQCSEAKVSLMITDLEDRGLVTKIKRGRGNIIVRRQQ